MRALRLTLVAVVLGSLLGAGRAEAQWTNLAGNTFNNPVSASLNQSVMDGISRRMLLRSMLRKRGGYTEDQLQHMSEAQLQAALGGAQQTAALARTLPAGTGAKFKPARGRLAVADLAANLTKDVAAQKSLRTVFEAGLQAYEKEAAKEGLVNDVAGALTFYLGTAYLVWHDGQEPDENGLTLVSRQLQQAFDTPEMQRAPDADKQRLYELLISLAAWVDFSWEQAMQAHDPAQQQQVRDLAGSILKGLFKLEPSQVSITSAGLTLSR